MEVIKYEDAIKIVEQNLNRINGVREGTMEGGQRSGWQTCKRSRWKRMIELIKKKDAQDVLDHYHELVELGVEDAYQKAKDELERAQEYLPFAVARECCGE